MLSMHAAMKNNITLINAFIARQRGHDFRYATISSSSSLILMKSAYIQATHCLGAVRYLRA